MTRLLPAFAASLALFAAVTLRAGTAAEPTIDARVPADFVEHADSVAGVSLRTPADWHDAPTTATNRIHLLLADRRASLVLSVVPTGEASPTLEGRRDMVLKTFAATGETVVQSDVVRVNGQRVARVVSDSRPRPDRPLRICRFAWLANGTSYLLTCATAAGDFDALRPTLEQVAASVTLPAPGAAAPADAAPTTAPAVALVARAIGKRGTSVAVPPDWAVLDDAHDDAATTLMSPDKQSALVIGVADAAAMNDSPEAMRDAAQEKYGGALSVVGDDDVRVGDRAMRRLTYDVAGNPLRYVEYGFVDRGSRGRLTLFAPRQRFESLRPTFERIAASAVLPDRVAELAKIPTLNATVPADFVEHSAGVFTLRTPTTWHQVNPPPVPEATFAMTTGIKDALFAVRAGPRQHGQTAESTRDALPAVFAQHAPNFKLVSADVVRLPSGPAARIVFDFDVGTARARTVTFAIGSGDSEYQLATIAPVDAFDALMPTIEQVVTSVRIAAAPAAPAAPTATPKPAAVVPPASQPPTPTPAAPSPSPPIDLGGFVPKWQKADGTATPLLATMTGTGTPADDGTLALARGQRMHSAQQFVPPVTFRIVARSDGKDVRLAYAFRQMIFDWEMRPTELRVDGGPIDGKHKPGAGALPTNQWTAIELVVTRTDLAVFVDGVERYRMPGDFTKINAPLGIDSHGGSLQVGLVDVVH